MIRLLLSSSIGVPIALLTMWLWFRIEMFNLSGRRLGRVHISAVVATAVLLALIAARFVKYA